MILFQYDLKAFHAGNAPQTVVDRPAKRNVPLVGQLFPCPVMVFIRRADHTIQIKDDRCDVFHLISPPYNWASGKPQNASTGEIPQNLLLPINLSRLAFNASHVGE